MCALGIKINFDERLAKLKKVLNIWSSRHLTILGRIAIVKNLALAKLVHSCSVLNVPVEFVKEVNRNIFSFIWNFKPDKVRRETMVGPICKGGLNMVNFVDVVKSLNIAWVNRYCKATDSHRCALLDSMLSKVGGAFRFQCNYELKLLDLKNLPAFYKNVLVVWQELNSKDNIDVKEIQHEILWNNRFIKINGKSIYYKTWVNRGILKVCDLFDTQGRFLCLEDFKCKFGVRRNFLNYAGVLAAIPKLWKSKIQGNNLMGSEPFKSLPDSDTIRSTNKARLILIEQSFSPPIVEINLSKQVPNEPFWKEAITWWNVKRSDNINPNYSEILYGYKPESKSFYALNHYLLIAKYHIFPARNQSESPSLKVFLALLESKIKCERQLAIKNSNYRKYEAKWTTLCICDV